MTDEDYVAELRSHGMLSTNQAADRIKQLTAERDRLRAVLSDIKTASVCSGSRRVAASALGEAAA